MTLIKITVKFGISVLKGIYDTIRGKKKEVNHFLNKFNEERIKQHDQYIYINLKLYDPYNNYF
jgi:hypothetical protein